MTFNVLFLVVCVLFLLFIWKGYNRGLLGIIFGIVGWIFVIYFVQTATPVIEDNLLSNVKVVETIGTKVERGLNTKVDQTTQTTTEDMVAVEKMKELLEKNGKLSELGEQTESLFEERKTEVISEAALVITKYIIHVFSFVAAIVVALIIVSLLTGLSKLINHAPILGKISRFLGVLFGACEGILFVWIMMYIISMIPNTEIGGLAQAQINENEFLLYLYENNILRSLFG